MVRDLVRVWFTVRARVRVRIIWFQILIFEAMRGSS
jgi:hypothetical protein